MAAAITSSSSASPGATRRWAVGDTLMASAVYSATTSSTEARCPSSRDARRPRVNTARQLGEERRRGAKRKIAGDRCLDQLEGRAAPEQRRDNDIGVKDDPHHHPGPGGRG